MGSHSQSWKSHNVHNVLRIQLRKSEVQKSWWCIPGHRWVYCYRGIRTRSFRATFTCVAQPLYKHTHICAHIDTEEQHMFTYTLWVKGALIGTVQVARFMPQFCCETVPVNLARQ